MDGNIVKVDNLRDKHGKRKGFMIVQNGIVNKYRQERWFYEFMLYHTLLGLAGTDFNLTIESVRKLMGGQRARAQKAIKRLEADGLLKARLDKDGKGEKILITQDGRKVPNTRRVYEIYTALPETQEQKAILLTPGTFITDTEFTADEILESESTPQVIVAEFVEPSKVRRETPPPVLKQRQSRENIQRDSETAMTIERRKEKIYRIAAANGLSSKTGKDNLLYWLKMFVKEVGRPAADDEIAYAANLLSGDSGYNLSSFVKSKALSELPA